MDGSVGVALGLVVLGVILFGLYHGIKWTLRNSFDYALRMFGPSALLFWPAALIFVFPGWIFIILWAFEERVDEKKN